MMTGHELARGASPDAYPLVLDMDHMSPEKKHELTQQEDHAEGLQLIELRQIGPESWRFPVRWLNSRFLGNRLHSSSISPLE